MFSEIGGLPLHPLAVHASVVLVPLAALLGILFAIPRTRAWSRIPLLLVSIGAAVSVFVSKESGEKFMGSLGIEGGGGDANPVGELIEDHEAAANLLFIMILIFAAVAIIAFVVSRNPASFSGPIAAVVSAVLVIGAGVVGFQTYRVGELGAKAVWNPTGTADFGSSDSGSDSSGPGSDSGSN